MPSSKLLYTNRNYYKYMYIIECKNFCNVKLFAKVLILRGIRPPPPSNPILEFFP